MCYNISKTSSHSPSCCQLRKEGRKHVWNSHVASKNVRTINENLGYMARYRAPLRRGLTHGI